MNEVAYNMFQRTKPKLLKMFPDGSAKPKMYQVSPIFLGKRGQHFDPLIKQLVLEVDLLIPNRGFELTLSYLS